MQLRYYFTLLIRYWAIILVLPLLVSGMSLYNQLRQPTIYAASARIMITQTPHSLEMTTPFPDFNLVSSWQSSQFILDDIPKVVESMALAEDISAWLKPQGYDVPPVVIQTSIRAETFHRAVTLFAQSDRPDLTRAILAGAIANLQTNGLAYWQRAEQDTGKLSVAVLNPPTDGVSQQSYRQVLTNVAMRGVLAVVAAMGIALLLNYLDDKLYTSHQIETTVGLAVLAAIPEEHR